MLTPAGAAHVESTRERWNSRVFRDRAARNALLAWLHDHDGAQQVPVSVADFLRDPRSALDGHFFSPADLDAAATYLCSKDLIEGVFVEEQLGPIAAWLTAEGIDCMEQGGNVAEYLAPRQGGVTYNFHGPVSGTNVAVGDNATQHATINGIDADNLRTLIEGITQAFPALALRTGDQQEAEDAAAQALAEIKEAQPSHPRLRAALAKIGSALGNAGNQALAAVLRAGIDYEKAKLGLPPGG
jgi:hypothetical protein